MRSAALPAERAPVKPPPRCLGTGAATSGRKTLPPVFMGRRRHGELAPEHDASKSNRLRRHCEQPPGSSPIGAKIAATCADIVAFFAAARANGA